MTMHNSQRDSCRSGEDCETMYSLASDKQPSENQSFAAYSALATLRLSATDLSALAVQGFVGTERRGNRTYFKLRFRRQRRQAVRYLGLDARFAAQVGAELLALQAHRRRRHELAALTKQARQQLRDAKRQLEPLLVARGFRFHGLAVRRPRAPVGKN